MIAAAGIGAVFVGLGLATAYVVLTTPLVLWVSRLGQGRLGSVGGGLVWALAFLVPGSMVVFGVTRLISAFETLIALRPPRPAPVASVADKLPDDYALVERVRLPDRRVVPEVVVGPAGLLIVEELPPREASRHRGPYWEVRLPTGRWRPIENPVDRAARDAARLKNWLRRAAQRGGGPVTAHVRSGRRGRPRARADERGRRHHARADPRVPRRDAGIALHDARTPRPPYRNPYASRLATVTRGQDARYG
jgi:hypothetical protein